MARLPYLTADDAPDAVAGTLRKVPPLRIISLIAHAETAFRPWLHFSGALLNALELDPVLRELAILQVGRYAARYEWEQHVPIALSVGVTDDEISALDDGVLDDFTPERRTVLEYVEAFIDGNVDDTLHAALAEHLSNRQIMELCLVAGHYLMLARTMSAMEIDPDPPAGPDALIRMR
jgi:alkylhydroperoxidase family enzyme